MAKRDTNSVQLICTYGENHGVSTASLLTGSNISQEKLSDASATIDDQQELQVLANLNKALNQPFRLGMELGSRYQLTTYGIMGYALLSSKTIRDAISLAQRYLSLTYTFCDMHYEEDQQSFSIKLTTNVPGDLGQLVVVRDLRGAVNMQKELFTAGTTLFEMHLTYSQPDDLPPAELEMLEQSLGGKIFFNAPHNALKAPIEFLDLPLPKANEMTARLCEQQCRELLLKKQSWEKLSEQVRDALLKEGLDTPMEYIAKSMARSERTLHRQLSDEGTSWRQVRDDVRMGLAEELLMQPLTLSEIAERLGYSDATNFSHSFKRCKGCSPSEFRKLNKR